MRTVPMVASVVMGSLLSGGSWAWAESRRLEQLPGDVARCSMIWTEIPRQMYAIAKEDGPLAAVTWGPATGAAQMVQSTTEGLWTALKPDQRSGHPSRHEKGFSGALFRYEF